MKKPSFHIYLFRRETIARNDANEVGVATTLSNHLNIIVNCTISIASKNQRGQTLNEVDMQNVILHEIGHSLGLHHSNYTDDMMHPKYTLGSPLRAVSNLNMLGVATIFQWLKNPSQLYPVNKWLNTSTITITSEEYQLLPIAEENSPPQPEQKPQPKQTILKYILELALRPEIIIPTITATATLIVAILLALRHKNKKQQLKLP